MKINDLVTTNMDDMILHLQKLVGIKSVMNCGENDYPFGQGNHDCLMYCLNLGESLGFTVRNIDEMCGYIEYGQGEGMIAVLTHLDVVPEGSGWSYDPYGAEIVDNRMYGRGTLDNKGSTVAAIYALKAIKDSGVALKHRIRLIFGLNEENGSACMQYYVSNGEELPVMGFTPDAAYPVINGEKGSLTMEYKIQLSPEETCQLVEFHGGTVLNVVPDYAYAVLQAPEDICTLALQQELEGITVQRTEGGVKVESFGRTAHAGRPSAGLNAIGQLFLALAHLPLDGQLCKLVATISRGFGLATDGANLGIAMSDEPSGALSVNLSIGALEGDVVRFLVNIRYPVTVTPADFEEKLCQVMTEGGFTQQFVAHKGSLYIPPEAELVQKLCAVYEEQTGQVAKPFCIGGATYAKELPNVVAFGPNFPGDESRIHRADEYMDLDKLRRHAQMNAAAMVALACP